MPLVLAALGATAAGYLGYTHDRFAKQRDRDFPSVPRDWWKTGDPLFGLKWQGWATLKRTDRLLALVEQGVATQPRRGVSHAFYAFFSASQYDYVDGLKRAKDLLKLEPFSPVGHYMAGYCSVQLGDEAPALRHWQAFLKHEPTSTYAPYVKSQLLRIKNSRGSAKSRRRSGSTGRGAPRSRT